MAEEKSVDIRRWGTSYRLGRIAPYTKCPYCGDETAWEERISANPNCIKYPGMPPIHHWDDSANQLREHCPKCGRRVFAKDGVMYNQPIFHAKEIVDKSFLMDWFINSVLESDEPAWTEEHIEELMNDFWLIPKDGTK